MTEIRQSFHKKPKKEKPVQKEMGAEFGAIIENDEKHYNKTGAWRDQTPFVSEECIGCGSCVEFCPEAAIEIKIVKGKKRAVIDYRYCKGCGICGETCPLKVVKMKRL